MNDLFDHIKDELDKHKNHQIDESVWQRIETELDQPSRHNRFVGWIPAMLAFLFGMSLMGAVWYGSSYFTAGTQNTVMDASIDHQELSETVNKVIQVDTLYSYDTIYVNRYRDRWLTKEVIIDHSSDISLFDRSELSSVENQQGLLTGAYVLGLFNGANWSSLTDNVAFAKQGTNRIDRATTRAMQILSATLIKPLQLDQNFTLDRHPSRVMTNVEPTWKRPLFAIAAVGTPIDLGTKKEKYLHKLWTYGARATIYPSDRWQVAVGLEERHYKGGYDQNLPDALYIPTSIEKKSDIIDFYYKTSFIDVPIFLQYNLRPNRNIQPYVAGGVRLSKITGYGADYLLNDGSELERKVNINSSNFFLNSAMVSSGVSIHTRSGFGAFAEAYYRRQINLSMLEFEKNNGIGLTVGAFYAFR